MVIHDREQEQQWVEKRRELSRTEESSAPQTPLRFSVMAIQSLACVVLLVAVLLFRVAGGSAYAGLRQRFSDALAGNELMAVWMRWWDEAPTPTGSGVKQDDFTHSEALE